MAGPQPAMMAVPPALPPPMIPVEGSPAASSPSAAAAAAAAAKVKPQTPSAPGTLNGPPSGNNHAIPLSLRRAEGLDLSTVERRGNPKIQPALPSMSQHLPKTSRPFAIPDAPIYRPTEEEFREPMEYIRRIAPEGSKYGIMKIIPPASWNPPFALNTERFHFRTRRQELNAVEGGSRVHNDYLDQLAKFHKQNGHNLNRFPSVDKRPLDLYRLKKTVERKGGFDMVCKGKRWAEVGRDLGYSGKIMSSLSTSLKNSYQKWLLPYEEYLRVAKPGVQQQMEMLNGGPYTPSPGPSPVKKSQPNTPGVNEETPAMKASAALHSTLNGQTPQTPTFASDLAQPPRSSPGGFTAVNVGPAAASFTTSTPTTSFQSVNGTNGTQQSSNGTPHYNVGTPQFGVGTPPTSNGPQAIAPHPNGVAALKRQHSENILTPDEIEAMNRRSKRLRKDVPTIVGSNMHHSRMAASRFQPGRDRGNFRPGEMCENCGKSEDSYKFISCNTCENVFHMYCLEPPLKQMPDYEWHCPKCLVGTNEYGFEEGDVYSLSGFQRKAAEFKKYHFNTIPHQFSPFTEHKTNLTEEDVEKEFWRLVEDINGTIEVEYGADIHSTTHGSGFPTIEKQPREPYSAHPWNLNILPLDKESLFRHIKSDISGMTVPWLYVGMVFSTFCWHNEDHYAYSANYQHFGETKTWYGIPAEDSEKFESAMREEVPELFEMQPDLLFQLVTLAKPEKLRKAGVRVYAIDQHAGEFVITFPQAYHAGFNHGFNFNEAVNFAPQDWEPFGAQGVRRLRDYRKHPCFSHDELLMTASAREPTIKTAKWLAPALERMRDEELESRRHFFVGPKSGSGSVSEEPYLGPRYESPPDLIDPKTEEEEVNCTYCKAYCYLSRYQCKKTGKYLCALHAGGYECCDALEHERYTGRDGTHRMSIRMDDAQLKEMVQKVVDKANSPEAWAAKVEKELDDNPRPQLKPLRMLLQEGERIHREYELPLLPDLQQFVNRCNLWVEEAITYITRKQQNRRKNEKAWRNKSSTKAAELEEREKELRSVDKIQKLLAKADEISFECPEISTLRERAESIQSFQRDANDALAQIRLVPLTQWEELLERGREFHVDMPQLDAMEGVVKRLRWEDRAVSLRPNADLRRQDHTLQEIEDFITEGVELGVPDSDSNLQFFREHKLQGELWEQKAKELMAVEQVHYQQLDSLSQQAMTLAVHKETLAQVEAILKKQRDIQDKIMSLLDRSKFPELKDRPKYKEMTDVLKSLDELQSKPNGTIDLEKEQKRHEDWMRKGKKLFGKANAPLHILKQHMEIVKARNEACFDVSDKPRMPVEPSSRQATPEEAVPISDGSNSSRDVFCICRKSEAGMMIECELCHEWYHGKCLKIARGKVKEDDKYTCPICDWRLKIPRDAARPKLEDLQAWHEDLEGLPFQPDEEDALEDIINDAVRYRNFITPIIHSDVPTTPEEIDTLRFHLRKIEGADILLAQETNFLRQELHKWTPVAPEPPPQVDYSSSTRKPRPTKQQKLMAQFGVTNPDDLPKEYQVKPSRYEKKMKSDEAAGTSQPTLQPAGSASGSQPPVASIGTPAPASTGDKPFYTPLAIHVLGSYAQASVVSKMLQFEPHMNRDKLYKMKHLLQTDRSLWDDLKTFQKKVLTMPTPPAQSPGAGYEQTHDRERATSSHRNSPMFQTAGPTSRPGSAVSQAPRLQSPARFASPSRYPTDVSPQAPSFDTNMFNADIFDSPSDEHKAGETSPDFDYSRMFDSPKPSAAIPQGEFNSPGFGGSQQSGGNIENVFADLLHDPGLDGANDTEEKEVTAEEVANAALNMAAESDAAQNNGDVEMSDVPAAEAEAQPSIENIMYHEDPTVT